MLVRMLVIDGVRYKLWKPTEEEEEFHPLVKKNYKHIFGEDSLYFDLKQKLSSKSGLAGIPDAYVITLTEPRAWYIVENELSSHDVYRHIVGQVTEFMDLIDDLENQRQLVKIFCNEIEQDTELEGYVRKRVNTELFRFLTELLSTQPKVALIIDSIKPELDKALNRLSKIANTEVVEFKTYVREGAENVRAHLFEPLVNLQKHLESSRQPEGPATEKEERRLQFFTDFLNDLQARDSDIRRAMPKKGVNWLGIPSGRTGFRYYVFFTGDRNLAIQLFLYIRNNRAQTKETYDSLYKQKANIEREFGQPLTWERRDTSQSSIIQISHDGDLTSDPQSLTLLKQWAVDTLIKIRKVFGPRIKIL